MRLHRRPMKPSDVAAAVAFIARHPCLRLRYGSLLEKLPAAWLRLLQDDSLHSRVFENLDGADSGLSVVAVSVFVTDEFLSKCKTAPMCWIGPELVRLLSQGESPVLTPAAVREANSDGGLNLAVWAVNVVDAAEPDRSILYGALYDELIQAHAGFQIKELVSQPFDSDRVKMSLQAGHFLWDSATQKYAASAPDKFEINTDQPFMIGVTRALASRNIGTWVSHLFDWVPPRIGFAVSEQRLLRAALNGLTDQELAQELLISVSAVKKTWRAIFERVAQRIPDLLPEPSESVSSGRGKEKRGRLLAYLREHPEELRPYARKLLAERHAGKCDTGTARGKRWA